MPQNNFYNEDPMVYTLTDEDGKQWLYELLDEMDIADDHYYALTPVPENEEEALAEEQPLVIMRAVYDEMTGEEQMESLVDEELDRIAEIFLDRIGAMEEALYDDFDEEE